MVRDMRQRGLQLFQAGRYDDAIAIWSRFASSDASLRQPLAEAYFRRSLTRSLNAERLTDVRSALELRPREPRFIYHLGLALHLEGDLDAAIEQYEAVLRQDPSWHGAALALARLEQNHATELSGYSTQARALVAPGQALLRGTTPAIEVDKDKAIDRLWRGLGAILRGDGSARETLSDTRTLPGHERDDGPPLLSWRGGGPGRRPRRRARGLVGTPAAPCGDAMAA
jgi:tetratricopeptide (TPR) repeat protein